MTGHASHGIFVGFISRHACIDVHLWVIGYLSLVHAIKSQSHAVGTPKKSAIDTELIAVYSLSVHDVTTAVLGQLLGIAMGIRYKELVVVDISKRLGSSIPFRCLCRNHPWLLPKDLMLFKLVKVAVAARFQFNDGLVGIRISSIHGTVQGVALDVCVYLL